MPSKYPNKVSKSGGKQPSAQKHPEHPDPPVPPTGTELEVPPSNSNTTKSDKCEKHWLDFATFGIGFLGFIGLIVYCIFTYGIYCASVKSAKAAKDAADVAKDALELSNRPWLSVSAVADRFQWKQVGSQISLDIRSKVRTKNFGGMPASSVYIAQEMYAPPPLTHDVLNYLKNRESTLCTNKGQEIEAKKEPTQGALVIYPAQEGGPFEQMVWSTTSTEVGWKATQAYSGVIMSGCILYRYASSPKTHRSGFIFVVMKKDPTTGELKPPGYREDIPIGSIDLMDLSGEAYSD